MDSFIDKTVVNTPPPPPLEIKIRTMRSDIDSMMKSGGGAPVFQDVAVSGLSMEKEYIPAPFTTSPMPSTASTPTEQAPVTTPQIQIEEQRFPAATTPEPAPQPVVGEEAGSDLVPKIFVGIVALVAIGVVGYFAYTIFI